MKFTLSMLVVLSALCINPVFAEQEQRPRARDIGLQVGTMGTGKYNVITDVAGVIQPQGEVLIKVGKRRFCKVIFRLP